MAKNFEIITPDTPRYGARREDIFIAENTQGESLGMLLIYPYEGDLSKCEHPLNLYLHLDVGDENEHIKDALLERALERAVEIKGAAGRPEVRVYGCFFKHQEDAIAYFLARGFDQDEGMLILQRETAIPLPQRSAAPGVDIRLWTMESGHEKERFIETHRQVFPRHPYSIQRLEELASFSDWRNYTAWDQEAIAGNIMVFTRQVGEERIGVIEDLFVLENYRRRGIGRALLHAALRYFRILDLPRVQLEMWSTNKPASLLYQEFGFKVVDQTELAVGMLV